MKRSFINGGLCPDNSDSVRRESSKNTGTAQGETVASVFTRPHTVNDAGVIVRGTAQNVLSRGCAFAFGYLATIILARHLGPADFGVYGFIMSLLLWIEQTSRFTISPATAILVSRRDHDPSALEQTALFLNIVLFLVLFVIMWFAAPLVADFFALQHADNLIRLAALDLPFFGMYVVHYGILQGRREFLSIGTADALYSLIRLAGISCLLAFSFSISSALVVNLLASVGVMLFVIARARIKSLRPDGNLIGQLIYTAVPLGLYMLALQTTANLDLWFLKMLKPSQEAALGMYVAARNVAMAPGVILMVVSDVLLPSLSHALGENDSSLARHYLQGGVRFLCIVGFPIVLLFMLAGEEIMILLYSNNFHEGAIYLPMLIFYSISLPFIDLFASSLSAHGQPLLGGITLLLIVLVSASTNIFLILSYGPVGAAYASALTGLLGVFALGFLVCKRFGSLIRGRTSRNVILAIALMSAIASQITTTGSWSAVVAVGWVTLYVFGLVLLGEITWTDVEPLAFWRSVERRLLRPASDRGERSGKR